MRQTFCHKWSKNEDTERNLHFIDLNGCYAEASRLFLYPTGKASILIDKYLDDISFDGEALKSSKKQIYGLIKAQILPSHTCEPMFPLKFQDKIFLCLLQEMFRKWLKKTLPTYIYWKIIFSDNISAGSKFCIEKQIHWINKNFWNLGSWKRRTSISKIC